MKIVKENLFEFERGLDPKEVLNLGKIKKMKEWLSQFIFNSQYTINQDYTIDIKGDFIITDNHTISEIPDYIQFNICNGYFICNGGHLKNLFGCPKNIKGDFYAAYNKIENLNGSPEIVEGDYVIKGNNAKFTKEEIRKLCEVGGNVIV